MTGKKKKRTIFSYIGIFLAILLSVALVLAAGVTAGYFVLENRGRSRLQEKQALLPTGMSGNVPAETESIETEPAETAAPEEETTELKEGELRYQGHTYAYKQDVMTFLFMGIDKKGEMKASENRIKGGQADAIFLLVLDPEDLSIGVIAVNRDTMTDVEVYDAEGVFVETRKAQIALQHAYGDGMEESCERTAAAVSKLFYGIPIHGYCAVNMEAITLLNDLLGGVDVTPGEDIYIGQKLKWKAGEPVHLEGKDAFTFVQNRDITVEQSAEGRLARQKLYLQAFMDTAKNQIKKDMTLPLQIYTKLSPYMVTDVAADEAVYLATQAISYHFDPAHMYAMEGEVQQGEVFEEFYQDDVALYELILDIFYEKKEES